jgi:hypothetical protein
MAAERQKPDIRLLNLPYADEALAEMDRVSIEWSGGQQDFIKATPEREAAGELLEACRMVEEWWAREGQHLPGMYGAPGCIFMVRGLTGRLAPQDEESPARPS